jgi:hypothetical protein
MATDAGFAVGVMSYDVERIGSLIWMAEPVFDEEPTLDQVVHINRWRWPVFFPLSAALRRKIVTPIGPLSVPESLQSFPLMRSRNGRGGWNLVKFVNGASQPCGDASDPTTPIYSVVNDTRLREMIVSGWRPEDTW